MDTANMPTPIPTISFGILRIVNDKVSSTTTTDVNPLANSAIFMSAKSFVALAIIFKAAPTAINPTPIDNIFVCVFCEKKPDLVFTTASFACSNLPNTPNAAIKAVTPTKPLTTSCHLISAKSCMADISIFTATANPISSNKVLIPPFASTTCIFFSTNDSSNMTAPTPTTPLTNSFQFNDPILTKGSARRFIAAATPIICIIIIFELSIVVVSKALSPCNIITISTIKTPIAITAGVIFSMSIALNLTRAFAIATMAKEMLIKELMDFKLPVLPFPPNLFITAIAAVNSTNKTVIAFNEEPNLSESTLEITYIAPANKAKAIAKDFINSGLVSF